MDEYYLIVGLGNPGAQYDSTRHNLGFMVVDNLSKKLKCTLKRKNDFYLFAKGKIKTKSVILAQPLTFMNRSGTAVSQLIEKYDVSLDRLLIIVDDLNLPFGKLRLRSKGSDGGHNGLASIIEEMSSEAFPRLRIGIGQEKIDDSVEFVLSKFDRDERKELPEIIDRSSEASMYFIVKGINKTMTKYNLHHDFRGGLN